VRTHLENVDTRQKIVEHLRIDLDVGDVTARPRKTVTLESLVPDDKARLVPMQDLDAAFVSSREDEEMSGVTDGELHRVADNRRQPVDRPAHVDRVAVDPHFDEVRRPPQASKPRASATSHAASTRSDTAITTLAGAFGAGGLTVAARAATKVLALIDFDLAR